jgi:RNA polymerase sigma factor (sigma-70 family)
VGQIRELAVRGTPPLDHELLGDFIDRGDGSAFAALVRRHGPLVFRVCRRLLSSAEDAEDAWQATFLVLARKAAAVRKRASVGSWLFGVARHVSVNLRRQAARRKTREQVAAKEPRAAEPETHWPDLQQALDEELERLPEHLRMPLVACYLEGETRDEAARTLGWSLPTLRGRLQRGRALLRSRLARRGVNLMSVLLAGFLMPRRTPAAAIQARLVEAAVQVAAGRAVPEVPARVLALTEGALQAMRTKTKMVAAVLVTLAVATAVTGWGFTQATAPAAVGTKVAPPVAAGAMAQAPPAAAQLELGQFKDLPDLVALAEKDVAIKKAALKAALAQKAIADAKLKILRSKTTGAEAAERVAKAKLQRMQDLRNQGAVDERLVLEAEASYQAAQSARQEADAGIVLGDAEVALEAARSEVAQAELDKAELQHKLLRDRLQPKK